MGYATNNPPRAMGPRKSGDAPCMWWYRSADSIEEITADGYFENGFSVGLRVGDVILVQNPRDHWSSSLLPVISVSGGAATLAAAKPAKAPKAKKEPADD